MSKKGDLLTCDFCGLTNIDVDYLIDTGKNIHICDNCVFLCIEVLSKQINDEEKLTKRVKEHISNGLKEKIITLD